MSGCPSPSVSTFAHASVGKSSLLSPYPVPSEPAGASPSVSSHSAEFNGNWSLRSSSPSSSESVSNGSVPAVASSASDTPSPSSSVSRTVPAGLDEGVPKSDSSVRVARVSGPYGPLGEMSEDVPLGVVRVTVNS